MTWKELLAVDWKGLRKKTDVDPAYRAVSNVPTSESNYSMQLLIAQNKICTAQ